MLSISHIPISILIHSAVLSDELVDDWGAAVAVNPVDLQRVRFEPYDMFGISGQGEHEQLRAVMFYDLQNSLPSGIEFKLKQRVVHDGVIYHIKSIEKLSAADGLHHIEVGLI